MKITPIFLAALLLATKVDEARASTMTARIAGKLTPKHDARSIQEAFGKAARSGSYRKINKVIKLASKHNLSLNNHDFEVILQKVAKSGNPDAIDTVIKFADVHAHPYDYHNTFGFLFRNAAASGNPKAIDTIIKFAAERGFELSTNDFTWAMAHAAKNGDSETIKHVFTAATAPKEIKLAVGKVTADKLPIDIFDFKKISTNAATSGDPQTIVLVGEIAAELGFKLDSDYFGLAMQHAAGKNSKAVRQVFNSAVEHGVMLNRKYFISALAQVATGRYSGYKTMALVIELAAKHGTRISADDFGTILVSAVKSGQITAAFQITRLAVEYGIMLTRKHFIKAMQATVSNEHPRPYALKKMIYIADWYGIKLYGNDYAAIMLTALAAPRHDHSIKLAISHYDIIMRINAIAINYGVKLEKKHFSWLLAKAAEQYNSSTRIRYGKLDIVIELTTSYDIEIDTEYFSKAISYVDGEHRDIAVTKLEVLAREHDIEINAEDF